MEDFKKLEKMLKAVANRRRVAILACLKKEKEMKVGNIAEQIHLSFNATSKHLGVLFAANLVDRDQHSLEMWYRLAPSQHILIDTLLKLF
jgi:DNA-binding transcriptional ArsR family regulator